MRTVTRAPDQVYDQDPNEPLPDKESGRFARLAALIRESADYATQKRTAREVNAAWFVTLQGDSRRRLRERGRARRAQLELHPRKP
jgi:hypothetical protein